MSWISPSTRTTGTLITAAIWNADIVANTIAINAGAVGVTSQQTEDVMVASSSSQLKSYRPAKSFMQNWFAWTNTR